MLHRVPDIVFKLNKTEYMQKQFYSKLSVYDIFKTYTLISLNSCNTSLLKKIQVQKIGTMESKFLSATTHGLSRLMVLRLFFPKLGHLYLMFCKLFFHLLIVSSLCIEILDLFS